MQILMQRTPAALEDELYRCYGRVNRINGVISFREPHFWSVTPKIHAGTIVVLIRPDANDTAVREQVLSIFREVRSLLTGLVTRCCVSPEALLHRLGARELA